jgi:phage terminase large subunit
LSAKRNTKHFDAGAQFIERYRFDPNAFAKEVLRAELQPWQLEANDAVADYVRSVYGRPLRLQRAPVKNYFTVRAMHGPGKTFWLAQIACWFGSVFPKARIPVIAPKFEQITTRLMLEIKKIRGTSHPDFARMTADIGAAYMRWFSIDDWLLFGQTANKAENLAGLHNDHQLVLVDEASGVTEGLFPTIEGALSTGIVQILILIGNPTKNTGTFAYSHLRPSVAKHYYQIAITLDKAPRVSRKWVQRMIDKYGADSPIVKIRCLGEFAEMNDNQLISPEWLARAREQCEEFGAGDGSLGRLRVTVDVADGGEDKTVINALRRFDTRRVLLKQRTYSFAQGQAITNAADEAERVFFQYGGVKGQDDFVVDSIGVGTGVADILIARGHNVIRYKGGAASDDQKRWRNRRVQSYMVLRDELRDGLLVIHPSAIDADDEIKEDDEFSDPWDEFDAQLCSIRTKSGMERVEDLQTKDEMKNQGIVSPDRADSLAMAYATQAPTLRHHMTAEDALLTTTPLLIESDTWRDYAG